MMGINDPWGILTYISEINKWIYIVTLFLDSNICEELNKRKKMYHWLFFVLIAMFKDIVLLLISCL